MKALKITILSCFFLLAACSTRYASNNKEDYLSAKNGPMLKVPAPLSGREVSHYYDLPNPKQTPKSSVSITPPVKL